MKLFRIIKKCLLILLILVLIILCIYTYFLSPNDYGFKNYQYQNAVVPSELNGFKIAYISDINLHQDNYEHFTKAIESLNERNFDMVIFGGDLYDNQIFKASEVSKILKSISCKYGKFAVLGDKDASSPIEISQILNDGGFEVLENQVNTLYYKNASFKLAGIEQDYAISKLKIKNKDFNLCITHQPDSFIQNRGTVNLQLSGHSYGGSLYVPFVGPFSTEVGARTYYHGRYDEGSATLIVSNGLSGPESFPYKLFARNQILFITLKSK